MFAHRSWGYASVFCTHLYDEGLATDAWSNIDSTAVLGFLEETADAVEHSLKGVERGRCSLLSFRLTQWVF